MRGAVYGFGETPFGRALVGATDAGVRALSLLTGDDEEEEARAAAELFGAHEGVFEIRDDAHAEELLRRAFASRFSPGEVPLDVVGTPFQRQVWGLVREIPTGHTTTYGELCTRLSLPVTSSRAVGGAVAKNPAAVVIPCHRVVRGDGALGGFRWGLEKKRALLAWEAALSVSARQLTLV